MASRAILALLMSAVLTLVIVGHVTASFQTEPIVDQWYDYPHNDEFETVVLDQYPAATFTKPVYHAIDCITWRTSERMDAKYRVRNNHNNRHSAWHKDRDMLYREGYAPTLEYEFKFSRLRGSDDPVRIVAAVVQRTAGCGYRGYIKLQNAYSTPIDVLRDLVGLERVQRINKDMAPLVRDRREGQIQRARGQSPTLPSSKQTQSALGMSLSDRKDVQRALRDLEYYPGKIDGDLGRRSRKAISLWQKNNKYPVSGYLNLGQYFILTGKGE